MNGTFDGSERAIVDALKAEAECESAPMAARERVAARLSARVGVVGLIASATVTAGSAGAAAVSTGTAGSGAIAASTLSLLGLSKVLALGMALGASTGLGLHFATQPPVTPARITAGAPVLPTLDESARAPEAVPTSANGPGVERESKPSDERRIARLHVPTPAVPQAPELPVDPVSTTAESLTEQQALLDEARTLLRRGDGAQALRALAAHRARFPRTAFEEERRVVSIRAELLLGNVGAARDQARAFVRSYPSSLLLPSLKSELGRAGLSGSETDRGPKPQSSVVGKDRP